MLDTSGSEKTFGVGTGSESEASGETVALLGREKKGGAKKADVAITIVPDEPLKPIEKPYLSIAGIHEIIVELDNLSNLLLKKHKYPKVLFSERLGGLFFGEKYAKNIKESVRKLERLFAEGNSSLDYLKANPAVAAFLLNRASEIVGARDPNNFFVHYQNGLGKLKEAFDKIKGYKSVNTDLRPAPFVNATLSIMEVKRLAKFRQLDEGSDFDQRTHNHIKTVIKSLKEKTVGHKSGMTSDADCCRYLRVDPNGGVHVYEKKLLMKLHKASGKGQEKAKKIVAVGSGLVAHTAQAAVRGKYLAPFIGPMAETVVESLTGTAAAGTTAVAVHTVSQNWWLKRYHTYETHGKDERLYSPNAKQSRLNELPDFNDQVLIDGNTSGISRSSDLNDQILVSGAASVGNNNNAVNPLSVVGTAAQQLLSAARSAQASDEDLFSLQNQLLAKARQLAGVMNQFVDRLERVHLIGIEQACRINLSDRDIDPKSAETGELIKDINNRLSELNTALNQKYSDGVEVPADLQLMITQLNALIDVAAPALIEIDLIDANIDQVEARLKLPLQPVNAAQQPSYQQGPGVN